MFRIPTKRVGEAVSIGLQKVAAEEHRTRYAVVIPLPFRWKQYSWKYCEDTWHQAYFVWWQKTYCGIAYWEDN